MLRPNALSIYKSDKENKLRYKIYLSDLSAVTLLKDPKQKRHNLFGLFSPARNWHFEAPTAKDAQEWVDLIRQDARIEEEEEELFLASPIVRRQSFAPAGVLARTSLKSKNTQIPPIDGERLASSSPEPVEVIPKKSAPASGRRQSHIAESSGWSGNELTSYSDFSDTDVQHNRGLSIESLAVQSHVVSTPPGRSSMGNKNASQGSGLNNLAAATAAEQQDPDRVVWQGWLRLLRRSKGGMRVRHWKNYWAVLRPRNLIFYKDESEYAASFIIDVAAVVNVVDVDPPSSLGRSKTKAKDKANCLQIITDEKSYRLRAPDEESLLVCLGAFKSLLARRRELEARTSSGSRTGSGGAGTGVGAGAGMLAGNP